jgi:hypothetical protein
VIGRCRSGGEEIEEKTCVQTTESASMLKSNYILCRHTHILSLFLSTLYTLHSERYSNCDTLAVLLYRRRKMLNTL